MFYYTNTFALSLPKTTDKPGFCPNLKFLCDLQIIEFHVSFDCCGRDKQEGELFRYLKDCNINVLAKQKRKPQQAGLFCLNLNQSEINQFSGICVV